MLQSAAAPPTRTLNIATIFAKGHLYAAVTCYTTKEGGEEGARRPSGPLQAHSQQRPSHHWGPGGRHGPWGSLPRPCLQLHGDQVWAVQRVWVPDGVGGDPCPAQPPDECD